MTVLIIHHEADLWPFNLVEGNERKEVYSKRYIIFKYMNEDILKSVKVGMIDSRRHHIL